MSRVFGLVHAIKTIDGPAGVAAGGIGIEDARKREAQLRESARGANRAFGSNHLLPTGIGAENDVGCAIFRGDGQQYWSGRRCR